MITSPALQDFLIGIITSIVTGLAVWLWQKIRQSQILNSNSKFFGLKLGDECLVVLGQYRGQNATSHNDIDSVVGAIKLIHEIGCRVKVASSDKTIESPGDITEFCIGGPGSNERTKIHLDTFLKDIQMNPYAHETAPLAIITKKKTYKYENGENEYAVLAKFKPKPNGKPVFLICGQTGFSNKGAVYFLEQNYNKGIKKKYGNGEFCLIVRVVSPWSYGHKSVEQVDDITEIAFRNKNVSVPRKSG